MSALSPAPILVAAPAEPASDPASNPIRNRQCLATVRASEILFVDPGVTHLETIFSQLRPGVEAFLLTATRPAAEQMAEALAGRRNLAAVHIMGHGAPGRIAFAA